MTGYGSWQRIVRGRTIQIVATHSEGKRDVICFCLVVEHNVLH